MTQSNDIQARLAPLREQIDVLDQQIIQLLNERAKVVVEVGEIKREQDSPIYAPEREQKVLEQVRRYNKGPLPQKCIEAIWREMMSGSFALERPLRIGYLGPPGSFSHLAAVRKFGRSVEYDDLGEIHAVCEEVARGHIDYGLVPIESSAHGGIGETLDAFLSNSVSVYAEVLIAVHQNLLSNCPVDKITKVYSKPPAFTQCRNWLAVQLSRAQKVPVASTSLAAEMASKEEGAAAVGSVLAGELYGLKVQFENIEDSANNITRFFVVSRDNAKRSGDDKTAIMFTTEHKAGSLTDVLDVFRDNGLNLTHIDKRPSRNVNWEYYFFVDFLGHRDDEDVTKALEEARHHCRQLTVLGSFPRAREVL
ncbi:MAG TPA: chorismate mutase [Phycisphaerales bacterium]|nr:chorismate mutase [Phycisphaerales bacterium]HCD33932.1 chorismate mutase [Phycisphaerales bacterium]|tara:strand:+ start:209 stop:1303 length:1095 start_codon:yes stop_codon:yes gene_type:complete